MRFHSVRFRGFYYVAIFAHLVRIIREKNSINYLVNHSRFENNYLGFLKSKFDKKKKITSENTDHH